jgi:CRP/FNR family transcriptional regulator, cyclic AMP receptor protein
MAKKAKKVPFDPKVFLATANDGRSLSKYRKNKVIFSQGEPADSVFYIQKVRSRSLSFPSKGRKPSLRSWVPTNSAERGA